MLFRRRRPTPPSPGVVLPEHWSGWPVPAERAELAEQVAASADYGVEREGPDVWGVYLYDDVRSLVGDDAIEALPARLAELPGVDEAVHVDREVIEVTGTIAGAALEAFVVAHLAIHGDPGYWDEDCPCGPAGPHGPAVQ